MSMQIKSILVFIVLMLSVSCSNYGKQTKSTKLKIDTTAENSNSEYRSFIKVTEDTEYQSDFDKSIEQRDYRFVGIMGYSLIIPGVPDYYDKYDKSNSVKIIDGTTDSYEDSVSLRIAIFKWEYAMSYNQLLLKFLSQKGD